MRPHGMHPQAASLARPGKCPSMWIAPNRTHRPAAASRADIVEMDPNIKEALEIDDELGRTNAIAILLIGGRGLNHAQLVTLLDGALRSRCLAAGPPRCRRLLITCLACQGSSR